MLRIELDWLLDYLLTGEESEHQQQVRQLLHRQPDGRELLRQARAALEILGDGEVGAEALERLALLESQARPGRRGPVFARPVGARSMAARTADSVPPEASTRGLIEPAFGGTRQSRGPDAALAQAVAVGSGQVRREKRRRLHKPSGQQLFSSDMEAPSVAEPSASDGLIVSYMLSGSERFTAPGPDADQALPLDRDGIHLRHEEVAPGEDRLLVTLANPPAGPALVTWIPDSGEIAQAHVDASGTATLPWPQPGRGVLRIDSIRTTVIPLLIDM